MRLKDKIAIITGAASGMGAATAVMFAREGAGVMLTDLPEFKGEAVGQGSCCEGGQAKFLLHDVSDEDAWSAVIKGTRCTTPLFGNELKFIRRGQILGDFLYFFVSEGSTPTASFSLASWWSLRAAERLMSG